MLAIEKTFPIPVIARIRTTCAGTQYVVETPTFIDVVTIKDGDISCTCHEVNCLHIAAVNRRRASERERDNLRDLHSALFNL